MNRTDLEKKLDEALSKANWGAPNTLLREIAAATHEYSDYPVVRPGGTGTSILLSLPQPPTLCRSCARCGKASIMRERTGGRFSRA